ncbi:MAG: agmatine deiminase family protein [Acidobacteriota bacterium]|nr:MAG: agmatine deiminase family protein [Acidobacteriota bacterium]
MKKSTVRWPAEWEPHSRCLMTWPHREDVWGDRSLKVVQGDYAAVAKTIARFEPLLMVANPGSGKDAKRQCGENVEVVEFPVDQAWMRDNGPIFVFEDKRLIGLNFRFNGWGAKYPPWENDDALPVPLCKHLNVECRSVDMVMEAGGIITDGEGTLITTEQCLLNPNRNPKMSRSDIEAVLRERLGVKKIIWLPWGLHDDTTDGHVACVVYFAAPAKILVQTAPPDTVDGPRLRENWKILEAATDARGRKFEMIEMPLLPSLTDPGPIGIHTYLNVYSPNGAVVVPLADVPEDEEALDRLRKVFPDREVVGVPLTNIAYGGGEVDCITQPMPAVPT